MLGARSFSTTVGGPALDSLVKPKFYCVMARADPRIMGKVLVQVAD